MNTSEPTTPNADATLNYKSPDNTPSGDMVAKFGRYYRNTRYIIFVLFMGFAVWCIRDGFFVWPKMNADARAAGKPEPHGGWDIPFNRTLAIALPPLAILLVARALYNSRGEYRLTADDVLHVPGHPPVPLDNIVRIDKTQWERKGIAYLDYELDDGRKGTIKLDDFVYDRPPTDAIYDRIEKHVAPADQTPADPGENAPADS